MDELELLKSKNKVRTQESAYAPKSFLQRSRAFLDSCKTL